MILDIDHIAFSTLEPKKHSEIFKKVGYIQKKYEKNLPNLGIKKPFLQKYSEKHDLLLLKKQNSYGIELLNHNNIEKKNSNIIPIFENFQKELIEIAYNDKICGFEKGKIKGMNSPICFSESKNNDFIFNQLIIQTNTLDRSKKFFEMLGFKEIHAKNDTIQMKFNSIFNNNKYFIIIQDSKIEKLVTLDSIGASCITFVSSSIKNEYKTFKKNNYNVTEIESLKFKNKEIEIFFVEGPSKIIIEIISPTKDI